MGQDRRLFPTVETVSSFFVALNSIPNHPGDSPQLNIASEIINFVPRTNRLSAVFVKYSAKRGLIEKYYRFLPVCAIFRNIFVLHQ